MRGLYAALVVTGLAGCATPKLATMKARPQGEVQKVRFDRGVPNVVSKGRTATVLVAPENSGSGAHVVKDRMFLLVGVKNTSARAFDFQEADVTATMDGQPLKVWTAREVEDEVRSSAAASRTWATIASVLGAVGTGVSAGTSYQSGYVGGASYVGTSYNASQANAAWQQQAAATAATFRSIDVAEAGGLAAVRSLLKLTTIDPGATVVGWIPVEVPTARPDRNRFELTVTAGGEGHAFVFEESVTRPSQAPESATAASSDEGESAFMDERYR